MLSVPGTNAAALDMQDQGKMCFMGVSFQSGWHCRGIVSPDLPPKHLLAVSGAGDADRSGDVCLSLFEQGVMQKMRGKGQLPLWKQQSRGPGNDGHSCLWKTAPRSP